MRDGGREKPRPAGATACRSIVTRAVPRAASSHSARSATAYWLIMGKLLDFARNKSETRPVDPTALTEDEWGRLCQFLGMTPAEVARMTGLELMHAVGERIAVKDRQAKMKYDTPRK